MDVPQNPAGEFVAIEKYNRQDLDTFFAILSNAPTVLRSTVAGLSGDQLDKRYRNWTIRQIVHHLADSHVNSHVRFKWTLTEDCPTIKAYDEGRWAELADSRLGSIEEPLALFDGIHARWCQLLRSMTQEQLVRVFIHPETGQTVSLWSALCYYAWHGRHHTAQIRWLRDQRGW
jgi:uncharacterized damage-inducible protein DinB